MLLDLLLENIAAARHTAAALDTAADMAFDLAADTAFDTAVDTAFDTAVDLVGVRARVRAASLA